MLQRASEIGTMPIFPRVFDRERGWISGTPWKPTSRLERRLARANGMPSTAEERGKNELPSLRTSASTADMPIRPILKMKIETGEEETVRVVDDDQQVPVGGMVGEVDGRQQRIWTRSSRRSGPERLPNRAGRNAVQSGTISMARGGKEEPGKKIWMPVSNTNDKL